MQRRLVTNDPHAAPARFTRMISSDMTCHNTGGLGLWLP